MPNDRDQQLLDLVDAALALRPDERADWLEDACAGDAELRAEVESLLEYDADANDLLRVDETDVVAELATGPESNLPDDQLGNGARLGDFLIQQQIGAGGMGVVYRAQQMSLNRTVALKVLPDYLRHSPNAQVRFRREIEAAAKLYHTNIVSVHATGEKGDRLFYAMELIDGPPLNQVLEHLQTHPISELRSATPRESPMPEPSGPNSDMARALTPNWAITSLAGNHPRDIRPSTSKPPGFLGHLGGDYFDRIAAALAEVADALEYAHQHEIIHRDIKPSNLLLSSDGRLHISDFGLARFGQAPNLTRTGECIGTPLYMSPEQISAGKESVDHRVDVYALGATLYELLTLRPPFVADSREQVLAQICGSDPVPPRRVNKRVPRDLQTICLKALEKKPRDRYQSAAELAKDLRSYVDRFAISAKRAGPLTRTRKWAQRHRGLSFAIAIAGVLATIAFFFAIRAQQLQSRWTEARQQEVFETALMAALEGKIEDANAAVDDARRLGAPSERIHLLEGQVDLMAADYLTAHQHFEKAAEQLPESVAAQSLLAYSCLRRQLYDQGEQIIRRVRRLQPRTLEDYLFKARAEAFFEPDAAAATLNEAVDQDKTSLVARLIRGEVQTKRAMDTADPKIAKSALDDYEIAHELLGNTPLVSNRYMTALLVTCTAYDVHGMENHRDETLQRAAHIADILAELDTPSTHRMRAFYFDYIGDNARALAEWRHIQDTEVLFLVLTLFRDGQFDKAVAACDDLKNDKPDRMMDFVRMLAVSATSGSPDFMSGSFPLQSETQLSPIHELLTVYTAACLTGQPEIAQREAARLKNQQRLSQLLRRWYGRVEEYTAGEISANQLIEHAGASRKKRCEGHYYIGITKLAAGDRAAALAHFQASAAVRVFNFYEHHLSCALSTQLKRDPAWPAWIDSQ